GGAGHRTLTLRNVCDRVVAAALNGALTPFWEGMFLPGSMGFRPGLGDRWARANGLTRGARARCWKAVAPLIDWAWVVGRLRDELRLHGRRSRNRAEEL